MQVTGKAGSAPPSARCSGGHAPGDTCPGAAGATLAFGGDLPSSTPSPLPDPLLGTQVGSFRIVRMLGRGGMGTVYLAEHPAIGSRVAVKFLHPAMAADAAVVARFYDEARAVNLVGHENIVGVFDLSLLPPDRYYFVMEYLEGETLQAHLRRGPIPAAVALDVLLQLCDALQCAHERGVVHRDLKPDNVFLVSRRGKKHFVKLVDFGIAKLRGAGHGQTQAGLIVGTPEYMAPEQCENGVVDARTDVYALGVMAFELATGRLPFDGTVTQLLLAHLHKAPPRPSALAPGLDGRLEAAILRALEKAPDRRFPDMAAFAEALRGASEAPRTERSTMAITPPPRADEGAHAAEPVPAARPGAEAAPRGEPATAEPAVGPPAVELHAAGAPPRRLPLVELTRAGLFLAADRELPPLFARVSLAVSHPSLPRPLAVAAEVVRHVAPAEAAALHLPPGFALQLVDLAPEARAGLAALAEAFRPRPAPAAPSDRPASPAAASARLDALEQRGADPYAFLGLPPDAEFSDVRRASAALRDELEALRSRPLAPDHVTRAGALRSRLEAARAALAAPASRLVFDARRGNWKGVRRCLAAGVPSDLVEARRAELLRAEPRRAAEAQRLLSRARVARKLGNEAAAVADWERAMAADPLDVATLDAYAAWRAGRDG